MNRYQQVVVGLTPTFRFRFDGTYEDDIRAHVGQPEDSVSLTYAPSIVPAISGQSLSMASANAGVRFPGSWYVNDPYAGDGPDGGIYSFIRRSVSVWFVLDASSTFFALFEEGGGTNSWGAFVDGGEIKLAMAEWTNTKGVASTSDLNLLPGQLVHVLATCDTSLDRQRLYVNGILRAEGPCGVDVELADHAGDWQVGGHSDARNPDNSAGASGFIGRVQDYLYWHEVELGPEHALTLYRTGMGDDESFLNSLNLYPYDPVDNPGGLAAGGYLVEVSGVSLVARAVRAMGAATATIQTLPALAPATDQASADEITALKSTVSGEAALASAASGSARASVPTFDFTLL